jgi:hypothetical protein
MKLLDCLGYSPKPQSETPSKIDVVMGYIRRFYLITSIVLTILCALAIATLAIHFTIGLPGAWQWVKEVAVPTLHHFFTQLTIKEGFLYFGVPIGAVITLIGVRAICKCKKN